MTDPEMILRLCAEAAPAPWYPKSYAQVASIDRDSLDAPLERLRMAGLIRLTDWVQGQGQGYVLTPEGDELLHNTRALAQLRAGRLPLPATENSRLSGPASKGLTPYQRGEIVRDALAYPSLPVVTLVLLFINILVFLYGIALAVHNNIPVNTFLFRPSPGILAATGAVDASHIVNNAWWRLLTCCFVHIGLFHLGVNMYTLYAVGPVVEQMWGRARFLALYLIAGLGGSCAQLIFRGFHNGNPVALAGASGALWGVMASMAVWIILNRGFLPRTLTATWLRQLGMVFLINSAISMMPGIGAAAHFGGGVVGALAAVLLNEQRFGRGVRRQLALAGLFALPLLCLGALDHVRATDSQWQMYIQQRRERGVAWEQAPREDAFRNRALREERPRRGQARQEELVQDERLRHTLRELNANSLLAQEAEVEARGVYDQVRPLLARDPLQRPPRAVDPALPALEQAQGRLSKVAAALRKTGPYEHEGFEKLRLLRADQVEARAKLLRLAQRCLQQEGQWTPAEQIELDVQDRLVQQLDTEWRRLIDQTNAQGRRPPLR